MNLPSQLDKWTRWVWAVLRLAVTKFIRIDGIAWAGAFAFNAFYALFPLTVLLVTITAFFVDREMAGEKVIAYMENYVPISGNMQQHIFDTIGGVIMARQQAGAIVLFILVWIALQCFTTLISATNRAWGAETHNIWRLPLKGLALFGLTAGTVLLGMAAPVIVKIAREWYFPVRDFHSWAYVLGSFVIPLLVVFLTLNLFYRLAPSRPTRLAEVWAAALGATVLLLVADSLFVIYLRNFAKLNAVYGAFGGIMALLLWIYLSGCIFIFGACLCAAQDEVRSATVEAIMAPGNPQRGVGADP